MEDGRERRAAIERLYILRYERAEVREGVGNSQRHLRELWLTGGRHNH